MSKWMLPFLVAILFLTTTIENPTAFASSLNDMKEEKQNLDKKKEELNSGIKVKDSEINKVESKVEAIRSQINELTNKVNKTNADIERVEEDIAQTTEEIKKLQESIAQLEKRIEERDVVLRDRIRAMQVTGGQVNYLDVLLGANSFSDFIDRFSAVSTLMEADRGIMKQQTEDKEQLEVEKKLVEQKLSEQEKKKDELTRLKASLDSQKKEKAQLVSELEAEQKKLGQEKQKLEKEYHEAHEISKEVEQAIVAEEARIAELARQAEIARKKAEEAERKKAAAAAEAAQKASASKSGGKSSGKSTNPVPAAPAPSVSTGDWTRPASGRISSEYGYRDIGFASSNHRGIDIANSPGTPILAAGHGVVQRTGVLGTYGNIIMIKHSVNGKIYTTLYAHLSSVNVSSGQVVTKGQVIGGMGNTGRSSGPHLHFEFHVGGWTGYGNSAVNPRSYVPF
ncbi:peptidoglycan DD-metalloendopeptidase family protein [Sporosarcina sp. Marseille-Q4063]|uniref:murein hydrolase activator EnvC family protein n=1 Tax=Sporosarcina sp. Marseille-Q4063 TaxID=2810514 RepID=UPI001BAF0C4E|nr:peptidoglycan DD-metalloendopeptidase family protein [Sporosarcina sp. Marseille-Q4063]QUW24070.1 peptidoglycan DD-metalloendopeptidase family protein [Sporosarcina sp. Marseille-Q4063]